MDIMVGDGLGGDTLFDLYDCSVYPGWRENENCVDSDVLVSDRSSLYVRKNELGCFHRRVVKDGVNLNGIQQTI